MTLLANINAFILMPFGDKIAEDLYKHSTIPICREFGLEIRRSDEIFSTNLVLDDILGAIKMATIIIADLTIVQHQKIDTNYRRYKVNQLIK